MFDRVVSANPNFRKYWLLHALEEPKIVGASAIVDCTQHDAKGRLILDVVLPRADNADLSKVGGPGKEFWVFGQNFANDIEPARLERSSMEPGAWRLELSPKRAAGEDLFLNVMQMTDRNASARWPVRSLEAEGRAGCLIEGPDAAWVALFRQDSRRSDQTVKVTIPGRSACRILVADLTPGQWHARREGSQEDQTIEVSPESGAAWLVGPAGTWTLTR
jgi:heparin/heparan-sulfate lyase